MDGTGMKIVVILEGALVANVVTDTPCRYAVMDLDVANIPEPLIQRNPDGEPCTLHIDEADCNPEYVDRVFLGNGAEGKWKEEKAALLARLDELTKKYEALERMVGEVEQ